MLDIDQALENAIRDGIREGIKTRLAAGYNNPVDKMIADAISAKADKFRSLLDNSLQSCLGDTEFQETIKSAVRSVLAKTIVQRFGGELEKSVNTLKSDPITRARIVTAIDDIIKDKQK